MNIIKYLIEYGANVNYENTYGNTPLMAACENNNEILVEYLVEHGAKIHKQNKYGQTALDIAIQNNNEKNKNLSH